MINATVVGIHAAIILVIAVATAGIIANWIIRAVRRAQGIDNDVDR
jgi:hypothetical protein